MSAPARQPAGVPTGGQFAHLFRDEPSVRLSPTDAFLQRHAREVRLGFERDVREVVTSYRSAATFRDADYIGSANLGYTAYVAAEEMDEAAQIRVEEAGWVLENHPGDREARDTCAAVIREWAGEHLAVGRTPGR